MAAGIIQLVAREFKILLNRRTSNYFFKVVYRRHTNFSKSLSYKIFHHQQILVKLSHVL